MNAQRLGLRAVRQGKRAFPSMMKITTTSTTTTTIIITSSTHL